MMRGLVLVLITKRMATRQEFGGRGEAVDDI
jgi:hypothetical protein